MEKIKTVVILGTFLLLCRGLGFANPEIVTLKSALVWRGDEKGDCVFKGNGKINGAVISEDGAIECTGTTGIYELTVPYKTAGLVSTMVMNWSFEGKVTMELSAGADYVKVINGVPLGWGEFPTGSEIKWKAALTKGSKLNEVNIVYTDISGVQGNWGTPELSGFKFRKPVYLKGSESAELFNYQMPVTIGESLDTADCDVYIKGIIQSDFSDIRFTQADKQTLLSVWRQSLTGETGKRKAVFWIKIPQLPKEGLLIYLYYGKENAINLSDGRAVFDLFDDFSGLSSQIASLKAKSDAGNDTIIEYKLKESQEIKTLDKEKMTNEEIINFFSDSAKYDWVRARQSIELAPKADITKTKEVSEELPNLANFEGVVLAENGDLVLDEKYNQGKYSSVTLNSDLPIRIMVASWKGQTLKGNAIKINISATGEEKEFKTDCLKDTYYYASREDFKAGKTLKWQAALSRKGSFTASPSLSEFRFDYRPGIITVVSPDGKETLSAGSKYEIKWSAWEYEPSYKMKLEYSKDAGNSYDIIKDAADNTGAFSWLVSDVSSNKVLVRISDSLSAGVYDTSNSLFSIVQGKASSAGKEAKTAAAETKITEAAQKRKMAKQSIDKYSTEGQEQTDEGLKESAEDQTDIDLNAGIAEYSAPNKAQGAKLYDVVVKLGDNYLSNHKEDEAACYKNGDIVLVMPHGHEWSETERNSFLIVPMYLTDYEAERLTMPKMADTGQKDKNGQPIMKTIKRTLNRIDPAKFGLSRNAGKNAARLREIENLTKDKAFTKQIVEEK